MVLTQQSFQSTLEQMRHSIIGLEERLRFADDSTLKEAIRHEVSESLREECEDHQHIKMFLSETMEELEECKNVSQHAQRELTQTKVNLEDCLTNLEPMNTEKEACEAELYQAKAVAEKCLGE